MRGALPAPLSLALAQELLHIAAGRGIATAGFCANLQRIGLAFKEDASYCSVTVLCSFHFCRVTIRFLIDLHHSSRDSRHYFAVADNVDLGGRTIAIPLDCVFTGRQLLARNLCRTTESQSAFMSVVGCKCADRWKQRQSQDHEFRTQGQLHTYSFFPDASGTVWRRPLFSPVAGARISYGHSFAEHTQFTCNSMQMTYNARRGVNDRDSSRWGHQTVGANLPS